MARRQAAPEGFSCPYRNRCPHLEGLPTAWIFHEYQQCHQREQEHWIIRTEMAKEIATLRDQAADQAREIDRLRAENRLLHQRRFKTSASKSKVSSRAAAGASGRVRRDRKPRGAPKGHPAWNRKIPQQLDHEIHVEAPLICPHCQNPTNPEQSTQISYIQEDIVAIPRAVVTRYVHDTAYCSCCRRQVIHPLEGELPFAPIGANAKAMALYLRHQLRLPYRRINAAMETLFGLKYVAASTLLFEKRARRTADLLYMDLIDKMRASSLVHADETHWRQDGRNHYLWYAGNESVAVFRIDPHRNSEAAIALLGEKLPGTLVTDAYAAYNPVKCEKGRQSCLVHILRKAKELGEELAEMKSPDHNSQLFCAKITTFFQKVCKVEIPPSKKAREAKVALFQKDLGRICKTKPLGFEKAKTLRQRLLPGSREYPQLFSFILSGGPPSNNHAERSLRPLVIFRKVCMGTRSKIGSENLSVFASLTQTAALQQTSPIDMFRALFRPSPVVAQDAIFGPPP